MDILLLKLLSMPAIILAVHFSGKKWGGLACGILIGLPLTSAPISFIISQQHGQNFAAKAAIGHLLGQIALCCFCLSYRFCVHRHRWPTSVAISISIFLVAVFSLNRIDWDPYPTFLLLITFSQLVIFYFPKQGISDNFALPPSNHLLPRILLASIFVITLTSLAGALGPTLSGLLAPFPVLGVIFTAMAQQHGGKHAASKILLGIARSSTCYGVFFLVLATQINNFTIGQCYTLAITTTLAVAWAQTYLHNKFTKKYSTTKTY